MERQCQEARRTPGCAGSDWRLCYFQSWNLPPQYRQVSNLSNRTAASDGRDSEGEAMMSGMISG